MSNYITNINDESIETIFALSDIHTDIHAFIIALRDCAKVIRKKKAEYDPNILDQDTEDLLNIDISDSDNGYIPDLNYEWVGENTHIVIIGDMLDGKRPGYNNYTKKIKYGNIESDAPIHEYLQIEIKLLLFINSLDKQAQNNNSRIHKICGNHELSNILFPEFRAEYSGQIFDSAKSEQNYYHGYTRYNVFEPKNPGYEILLEGGLGILLKINNNIFVHASLQRTPITYYNTINNDINNQTKTIQQLLTTFRLLKYMSGSNITEVMWNYSYGQSLGNFSSQNEITNCDNIITDMKVLMGIPVSTPITDERIRNLRVIVGHCIQKDKMASKPVTVYHESINKDDVSKILSTSITGTPQPNNRILYGITMDCQQQGVNRFRLYRVDIGTSRSQDKEKDNSRNNVVFNKIDILTRTPHILKIVGHGDNDSVSVVRSKLQNTLIHLPRNPSKYSQDVKDFITSMSKLPIIKYNDNDDVEQEAFKYFNKYLKYKEKYIQLKNKL